MTVNQVLNVLEKNIKNQIFLNFKEAIIKNKGVSLISEIKKASPSAGILIDKFNHLIIFLTTTRPFQTIRTIYIPGGHRDASNAFVFVLDNRIRPFESITSMSTF